MRWRVVPFLYGVLVGILLVVISLTALFGLNIVRDLFTSPVKALLQAYDAVYRQHLRNPPANALAEGAIEGILKSTGDEFSYYYSLSKTRQIKEMTQGKYVGVGIETQGIEKDGSGVLITQVESDSPASKAGLRVGDSIKAVGNVATDRLSNLEIGRLLEGSAGSTLRVVIERGSQRLSFEMVREERQYSPIETKVLAGGLGYLRISDFFSLTTASKFRSALQTLRDKGVKAIILDLRDNAGGRVDQAIEVADSLLTKGSIFVTRDKTGNAKVQASAKPEPDDYTGRLLILANHLTISAGEILVAALKKNGRARVLGEKTAGKGVANLEIPLANGGSLILAVADWLTPNGNAILHRGIVPNIPVQDSRLTTRFQKDAELGEAVRVITLQTE